MAITKISPDVVDFDAGITISTADNTTQLTLKSTDADANTGPVLNLQRDSGSPADNDYIGNIKLQADNDAGEVLDHVSILGQIVDASDGTEDAKLITYVLTAGTVRNALEINPTEVVINEDSIDRDFRVESDQNTHRLFVDAGQDKVLLGTTASRNLSGVTPSLFQEGTSYDLASMGLVSNVNDSTGAYIFIGKSRGASNGSSTIVQSGDQIGGIYFQGADGTDIQTAAGYIDARVDGTPGSNDMPGRLGFWTTPDGAASPTERMRIHSGGVVSIPGGIELGSALDATAANTLDDYEEGAWTGVITTTGTDFSFSGSRTSNSYYIKVGNQVTAWFDLTIPSPTSGSGSVKITGLPFAGVTTGLGATSQMQLGRFGDVYSYNLYGYMGTNSDEIFIKYLEDDANPSAWPASQLNGLATPYCTGSITYYTTN